MWKNLSFVLMTITTLATTGVILLLQKNLQLENQVEQITLENQQQTSSRVRFHEDFDDNVRNWPVGVSEDYEQSIADEQYYFQINNRDKLGWVAWSYVDLPPLPSNYDVELVSNFIDGDNSKFSGLWLGKDHSNFLVFEVNHTGSAQVRLNQNDQWGSQPINPTEVNFDTSQPLTQLVEIRGDQFSYYVNGQLVGTGSLGQLPLTRVGVSVEYTQTIGFDSLTVTVPKD